jgi:TonB-dependent SusC/RagA subfamily outer membrane receptor
MNLPLIRKVVFQERNNTKEYPGISPLSRMVFLLSFVFIYMGLQAQTITLNKKRISAEKVITAIQEQSGYNLLYASGLVDDGQKTDVSLDKATLTQALDVAVSKQPYVYEFIGNTIVLKGREEKKEGSASKSNDPKQEEMVSNGYQSISKKQSTGSYSQVSREEIERNSSTSIMDQLRKLPGVTVSGNSIVIRGINTMMASTDPLVLLDGVTYPAASINSIDPNMVQNITVLKDAETSMYGSRGSNGVILITTRRGGKLDQNKADLGGISSNKDGSYQLTRASVTILLTTISQWYQLRLSFEGGTPEGNYSGRLSKDIPLGEMIYILQTAGIRLKQNGKNIVITG